MREGKLSFYYVDKDHNGQQSDMPFDYCLILTFTRSQFGSSDNMQGMSFAFNITTGQLKFKCFSGIGSDRDYAWKTITLT